ncbi:hypothetical protein [Microbispora sp. NPDC049125]|uniref:hypothetical protein n=1 Tax=Microbispora sp. NPDC049125 TaxID=3154929 RepID=UPI003466CD02
MKTTHRESTGFKVHLWRFGPGAETLCFLDGPTAEKEAFRLVREHTAARPRGVGESAWAHIEYVLQDGAQRFLVTYARINQGEQHTVRLFNDPDSPTRQRYTCSCGARRYDFGEMQEHQANVGRCTSCWGNEELHPKVNGTPDTSAWVPCPSCKDNEPIPGAPPLDETRYTHPDTLLRREPVSADRSF